MGSLRSILLLLCVAVAVGCARAAPPPASASPPVPADAVRVSVVRVIDGDTIKVQRGRSLVTVRILGMDTPETHDPRKPVQCFGKAAADRAHQLLAGRHVTLAGDPTQSRWDRYGRELDYVWLPDGTSYDWKMIRDGFAHEYTYKSPYEFRNDFLAAQAEARSAARGFWSPSTCGGNTTKAASQ